MNSAKETNNLQTSESILVLTQASSLLAKIEGASKHCETLIKKASIDTLFILATQLRLCKTWILELQEIEEKITPIMQANYHQSTPEQADISGLVFEQQINRIFATAGMLDTHIGVERIVASVGNIWASSRRCNREIQSTLKEITVESTR